MILVASPGYFMLCVLEDTPPVTNTNSNISRDTCKMQFSVGHTVFRTQEESIRATMQVCVSNPAARAQEATPPLTSPAHLPPQCTPTAELDTTSTHTTGTWPWDLGNHHQLLSNGMLSDSSTHPTHVNFQFGVRPLENPTPPYAPQPYGIGGVVDRR